MIRYERFGLGVTWNEEYGTVEDAEQFGWLIGYSPYHNVHEGTAYPSTLFPVFEGDTRVDPLHARKLAAALQHATSAPIEERPVLYCMEAEAGHAARSVSKTIALFADLWGFMAAESGTGSGADRRLSESWRKSRRATACRLPASFRTRPTATSRNRSHTKVFCVHTDPLMWRCFPTSFR